MLKVITSDALEVLNELSARSVSIQAAVAYWTVPPGDLSPLFHRALSHPDGYLCCDLHSPTSIDCLAGFRRLGANVHILLYRLIGRTEVADSKGIPDQLMHSKVLVFNTSPTECHVWVGSHNATNRALRGINFECAVLVRVDRGSAFHREIMAHLEEVRVKSTGFDLADVEYYRSLQGVSNAEGFIEVVQSRREGLAPDEEVTVYGTNEGDHTQLKRVGSKLVLSVTDDVGLERLYRVNVSQTGRIDPSTRRSITFGKRRYAFKAGVDIPELLSTREVCSSVYEKSVFFAVLRVESQLSEFMALEAPPAQLWHDVPVSSFRGNPLTSVEARPYWGAGSRDPSEGQITPLFKDGRGWRIQRADPGSDVVKGNDEVRLCTAFVELALPQRQLLQSKSLLRQRLLVRRPESTGKE